MADLRRIVALGVNVVGGCCGTTPEFIERARSGLGDAPGEAPSEEAGR